MAYIFRDSRADIPEVESLTMTDMTGSHLNAKATVVVEGTALISPEYLGHSTHSSRPAWRPWPYHYLFFALPLTLHMIQIVSLTLVVFQAQTALKTEQYNFFQFGADNAVVYIAWQYLPMISTIGVSILWETIDVTVRRLEPFYQLSLPKGASLNDSLNMDYVTAFNYFVPIQAWRHKHWAVCLSSTVYVLTFGILPVLTSAIFRIGWQGDEEIFLGYVNVNLYIVYGTLGVQVLTTVLGFALLAFLHRRASGLFGDPASIGGLAALISGSDLLSRLQSARSYDDQAGIDEVLEGCRLRLDHDTNHGTYRIQILYGPSLKNLDSKKPFRQSRKEAHPVWLWGRTTLILGLLQAVPSCYIRLATSQTISVKMWALKPCFTLLTVISSALWQMWQRDVSMLEPYYQLTPWKVEKVSGKKHRSGGSASAVHFDFISCPSFGIVFHALRKHSRSILVSYISFCSFLVQVSVIYEPIVFEQAMDVIAAYENSGDELVVLSPLLWWSFTAVCYISYPLMAVLLLGWIIIMARRRKPVMPRKPLTLSSIMVYLCHSTGLLDDFAGTSTMSKTEREHTVRAKACKYRFGWFKPDGDKLWCVGVERAVDVEHRYKFGQTVPNVSS